MEEPTIAEPLVVLDKVTVGYGVVPAISGVSVEVHSGDYLGIVGPSGSGKTTCLKAIAGAVRPQQGRRRVGRGVRLGYVPQVETVNWYFPVTVLEVLLMAQNSNRLVPWASREERLKASALLEALGLAGLADRHIRSLSGGQQQRVFIARALIDSPQLLLLDEPTSGVDVATRHEVLHLLHDLNHDRGLAVVITTHDLNGIAAHMHTVVCLNREVVAMGPPEEILSPDVLERTYGAPMDVLHHGGMPVVVEHLEAATPADSPLGSAHHEH
jgi:ABC-type Mn2+/Zn2+ transport system ATPase subunit